MVKIRQSSNKEEILKKKKELADQEQLLKVMADQDEIKLDKWLDKYFSNLPKEAREGIEVIVKALWANTKVTRNLWQRG